MKIIRMISDYVFEVQKDQDAMLIGVYYPYPAFHHLGFWWGWCSDSVMIANDNRFEGL